MRTTVSITINGEVLYSMTHDVATNATDLPDALARPVTQYELWCILGATEWALHHARSAEVAPGGPHVRTIVAGPWC